MLHQTFTLAMIYPISIVSAVISVSLLRIINSILVSTGHKVIILDVESVNSRGDEYNPNNIYNLHPIYNLIHTLKNQDHIFFTLSLM